MTSTPLIRSAETFDFVIVAHPDDLADITAGLRVALEIADQSPIAKYLRCLNLPTRANPSDAALTEHAKRWSQTEYHAVGTCAMGVGENAVVDPQLKMPASTAACRRRLRDADHHQR